MSLWRLSTHPELRLTHVAYKKTSSLLIERFDTNHLRVSHSLFVRYNFFLIPFAIAIYVLRVNASTKLAPMFTEEFIAHYADHVLFAFNLTLCALCSLGSPHPSDFSHQLSLHRCSHISRHHTFFTNRLFPLRIVQFFSSTHRLTLSLRTAHPFFAHRVFSF